MDKTKGATPLLVQRVAPVVSFRYNDGASGLIAPPGSRVPEHTRNTAGSVTAAPIGFLTM